MYGRFRRVRNLRGRVSSIGRGPTAIMRSDLHRIPGGEIVEANTFGPGLIAKHEQTNPDQGVWSPSAWLLYLYPGHRVCRIPSRWYSCHRRAPRRVYRALHLFLHSYPRVFLPHNPTFKPQHPPNSNGVGTLSVHGFNGHHRYWIWEI